MKSHDPDILLRQFLDGELSGDETRQALHRIAEDADARETLQFELEMTRDLAASRSPRPCAAFASRTMDALTEADATEAEASLRTRLSAWWRSLTEPIVTVPVRPAYTAVALVLAGLVAWLAWPSSPTDPFPAEGPTAASERLESTSATQPAVASGQQDEVVWTRFVYTASDLETGEDPESVAVAGDFSNWEPVPLSPRTAGDETVWTGLVPVPRGEHEYQFVIDGKRWVTDPLAPVTRDDGFGAQNAVLKL